MKRGAWLVVLLALAWALPLQAQESRPAVSAVGNDDVRVEEAVVVVGEQPGPGMWIVRSGSHDLYLLGTLSPLPDRMQWRATQVQTVLAQAQEVIRLRGVRMSADIGFFRSLLLMPKLLGARKSPDGRTLQELVSPGSYARWRTLKSRYIGSDSGIERWRPLFAAQELYVKAMKRSGLDLEDRVWPVVAAAIEQHHPSVTTVEVPLKIADPKSVLKEWSKTTLDDLACFDNTMTSIETDIDAMRARANAWAIGDIAALRALPPAYRWEACRSAVTEAGIGKRLGYGDARQQLDARWLGAAQAALEKNNVTFAAVPLGTLLGANGYLARLEARGYTIIAPDEDTDADESVGQK